MPTHFKKRKGPHGPSKNEEKVMRAKDAENQARMVGDLSSRFPTIKHLKIHLIFRDTHQLVLDEKNLSLGPSDTAAFTISCPGRCGKGSFDFGSKIEQAVTTQLSLCESSAKCPEPLYADSPEACGCEIKCRMEIDYFPAPPPAEKAPNVTSG